MFYILYETTNSVNGKIYRGIHKTLDVQDDYLGSGKLLNSAIKKYGKDKFIRKTLWCWAIAECAYYAEELAVDESFLLRKDVYNIKVGGLGGFDHINSLDAEDRPNVKSFKQKVASGEIVTGGTRHWTEESYNKVITQGKLNNELGLTRGWKHSEQFKIDQSLRSSGDKNSQFGTMWITNGIENKKIKKDLCIPNGWYKGRS